MKCEYEGCDGDCKGEISNRHAMTAYVFDGVPNSPEDPNRDFLACEYHHDSYVQHWQEQWDEYHQMILGGIRGGELRRQEYENRKLAEEENRPSLQEQFEDFASRINFT